MLYHLSWSAITADKASPPTSSDAAATAAPCCWLGYHIAESLPSAVLLKGLSSPLIAESPMFSLVPPFTRICHHCPKRPSCFWPLPRVVRHHHTWVCYVTVWPVAKWPFAHTWGRHLSDLDTKWDKLGKYHYSDGLTAGCRGLMIRN